MPIDWTAVVAIGTFGQFLVVTVAALLGLRQLQTLGRQSELEASLPILSAARAPDNQEAYDLVVAATDGRDPALCAAIAACDMSDPKVAKIVNFAHFLNETGLLVEEGLIKGTTIIPHYRVAIVMTWDLLVPFVVRRRREAHGTSFFAPFEALAVRARAMTAEERFASIRHSLPRSLRPAFDRSLAQTRAPAAGGANATPDPGA